VYIRYFWQGNYQIYGHIRFIYTVLANPTYLPFMHQQQFAYCLCSGGIQSRCMASSALGAQNLKRRYSGITAICQQRSHLPAVSLSVRNIYYGLLLCCTQFHNFSGWLHGGLVTWPLKTPHPFCRTGRWPHLSHSPLLSG